MSAPRHAPDLTGGWWTKPALLIAVIVLAGAPLWWPAIPPLTDLLGHMGRYAVQLDGGHSADLARWYHFEWRWLGNLGVDLLVHLLGPVLGVEAATKLVVIAGKTRRTGVNGVSIMAENAWDLKELWNQWVLNRGLLNSA